MSDFFIFANPANPYHMRLSDNIPVFYTHLICRRAIFINWRSIIQMINLQTKFGELNRPQAFKVKFSAKNIPAKSNDILSTFNGSSSAAEGGKRFVFVPRFNSAKRLRRMADVNVVNASHLHIDSLMPPFCSFANHFWKQRFELDRFTLATRITRRDL